MIIPEDIEILKSKITNLKHEGNYRTFNYLSKNTEMLPKVESCGRQVTNFCGNDYLASSTNKTVIQKMVNVLQTSGAGSGGTRNIGGSSIYHLDLERLVATIHKKDAGLIFNSAYMANLTGLSVICKIFDDIAVISDEMNHASIINGIKAGLVTKKYIFKHNDLENLEQILKSLPYSQRKIIVFESVYSIFGSKAPIPQICDLAKKYNAITYIDEVHSVGLYGSKGYGLCEYYNLESEVDIINGTFAKAYGLIGGYLAGNSDLIDCIRSFGSGFIFTTSLQPSTCAGIIESIKYVAENPNIRKRFFDNVQFLKSTITNLGVQIIPNDTHIVSVVIGNGVKCNEVSAMLFERGFYVQPINYPTVSRGKECLRITITPLHTKSDIESFATCLSDILCKK